MVILTAIPFAPDLNLGRAYNATMELLPEGGWACFLDHDAAFTTPRWHEQLLRAIEGEPRGSFTAVTNRIASSWQRARDPRAEGDDMEAHRRVGADLATVRVLRDVTDAGLWGGVLMRLSKAAWLDAGGFADGLLCADHVMHRALRAAGRRVYLIEGLYVYHYRGTSRGDVSALPVAVDPATGRPCHDFSSTGRNATA